MTDFRILAQMSSDALLAVDEAGRILYANPAAQTWLAPHAGSLLGQTTGTLWQPDPFEGTRLGLDPAQPLQVQLRAAPGQGATLELARGADGATWYLKVRPPAPAAHGLPERVGTALALSTDAAMVMDAHTLAFLDVNPAACALMGRTREAVLASGPTHLRRRDGAGVEDFHHLYRELIEHAPQALTREYDFVAGDGRSIPIAATRQALSVDGRWLIFVTWRDISERVAAQTQVQQLKDAFDQTADAINIVDIETLTYVYVNEAFSRMLALPRAQVMARGPLAMPRETVIVDDLREYLASLVAQHPSTVVRETLTTLPDGSQQVIESHHHAFFSGGRWLARSTRVDITQRKRQQRHLERILAAFDASGDGIYIIDPRTFGYVDVNEAAARLHGVTREQLRGMGVRGAFPGRFDEAGLRARYDELIALSPQSRTEERQIPRRDGVVVWAESIRRAIQVDGEWLVISVMRDITDRKAAQARLAQFKAAFDQSSDAVAIVDIDAMAYVYNNDANLKLLGVTRHEMDLLTPPEVARRLGGASDTRAFFAQLVAQYPEPITRELSYTRADGAVVHYSVRHQAMHADGGWLAISTKTDITEQREAQLRLELLNAAMEAAPDAIQIIDAATLKYISVNGASAQLVGMPREEMLARGIAGVFQNEPEQARLRRLYARLIEQTPTPDTEVHDLRLPSGHTVAIEATRRAIRLDGRWVIVSVNRDITARKAAEAGLKQLKAVIDVAPDGMYVVDPYRQAYVALNHAAGELYGFTREQVLDMGMIAFLGRLHANDPGFTLEAVRATHMWLIQNHPQVHLSRRRVRMPGRADFVAETLRQAVQVDGQWLILVVVRDITEREAARERSERFAAIVNLSADAVLVFDRASMAIVDVNDTACRMYGYTRDQFLALAPHAGRTDASLDDLARQYDAVIAASPRVLRDEITAVRKDGSTFPGEVHRQALPSEDGWLVVATVRDITERRQAEEEIRLRVAELTRSNQELEQFAYVTSHDLSEPLRMVASYTQLLARRYADKFDDDGREFIKYAVDGAQRMKQLIDDLLMYSRAGRHNVQMRPMRMDRALDDALANLANAIERTGATIERDPLPELVCEKAGLTQVFQNLIGNALKFRGDAAPVVRISTTEDEHFWTISVTDNGIGIAPEYFQRIFIIFQRLHSRTKYEGTGIGLSICKKIVERHGGQISVTSEPGQGTTFSFTLSKALTESEPS